MFKARGKEMVTEEDNRKKVSHGGGQQEKVCIKAKVMVQCQD